MDFLIKFLHDYSIYIVIILSIILTFIYLNRRKKDLKVNSLGVLLISILHAVFFLLSCKLLVYIEYGIANAFLNMPKFSMNGGYSFFGNIYIMPIFYIILALILRKNVKKTLDIGTPAILISAFCARLKCYISGCCLGMEIYNTGIRVPTRMIELLCYAGIFIFLLYKQKRKKLIPGTAFPIYLMIYGYVRLIEEPFRENFGTDIIHFAFIHCTIAIIVGIVLYCILKLQNDRKSKEGEEKIMKEDPMKKIKNENGITLIALIITIIILVILAAVSIRSANNMRIAEHAINGSQEYAKKSVEENTMMESASSLIKKAVGVLDEIQNGEEHVVTNPYKELTWEYAWGLVDDAWTERIEAGGEIPEGSRITAKMYETTVEVESTDKCNPGTKTEYRYQIVFEGEGNMPNFEEEMLLAGTHWGTTSITSGAKGDGANTTEVYICDGITSIGDYTFQNLFKLELLEISDSVTSIGNYAFESCTKLNNIYISKNIANIGTGAFLYCGNLNNMVVNIANPNYYGDDNNSMIVEKDTKNILRGCEKTIIPNDIKTIGCGAFSSNTKITNITIPNSVITIDSRAFHACERSRKNRYS